MKKFFIYSCLSLILLLALPAYAQPAAPCANTPPGTLCDPTSFYNGDIKSFAFQAVVTVSTFFSLIAVIMVVFSGFRMIMSQGDAEEVTAAKNALTWSIFGLILAMFAFVIVNATATYIGANNPDYNSYQGDKSLFIVLQDKTFGALLSRLLIGLLQIIGIISILMIIIGGFRYVISAGNEEQAESGKKTLQWAIIGLVTVLLAYVLVRATFTFFLET